MKYTIVCASVLCSVLLSSAGAAQNTVAFNEFASQRFAQQDGSSPSRSSAKGLESKVSVNLSHVTLEAALQSIASQASLTATFGPLVANQKGLVTLRGDGLSAREALDRALAGTGIGYSVDGKLLVFERARVAVAAQGVVVGRVINAKTKQPVVGATVTASSGSQSVKTADDGTFRLSTPVGEHTVQVRAVGLVRLSKRVTVVEGESVSVEFVMDPTASVLDEVIVTGTVVATERKAIPNPITVITAEDIEKRGITRIEELMRGDIPGVLALEEGTFRWTETSSTNDGLGGLATSTVYARGSSGTGRFGGSATPLKTFIDGVELLDPSYLGTIDPRSIDRIEVVTGPQAATIYGAGAMGGVMQIFTKKGSSSNTPDFKANFRYGVLQSNLSDGRTPTHSHTFGLTGGTGPAFSYASTMSYDYTGQWQPGLFNRRMGASVGITSRMDPVTVTGSVSTTGSSNGTSQYISGGMIGVKKRQEGEWQNTGNNNSLSQRISKTSNQTLAVTIGYRMWPTWQHGLTVGRSQNVFNVVPQAPKLNTPSDTLFKNSHANGQRTNWSYNTTKSDAWLQRVSSALTLGASGSAGSQTRVIGCTASETATAFIACGTTASTAINVTKSLDDRSWGGFGSWRVGFFDQLYLTLGLRGERNPNYGIAHKIDWTPTNGIAYTMEFGDLTVKMLGSYGRATRTPPSDAREEKFYLNAGYIPSILLDRIGNPELRPEYSRGPQGGMEIYLGSRGSLTINHYQQKVTDLLQNVNVDSVFYQSGGVDRWRKVSQWQNIAKVKQFGWETTGSLSLGVLALQGTYSWNDSRILSLNKNVGNGILEYEGMSFIGIPSHIGSFRATYAYGGTSVSMNASVIGKSLISGVIRKGDDAYYYEMTQSREKAYIDFARNDGGNLVFSKPGYTRTNIAVSQRLSSWASATMNMVNAGNNFTADGSEGASINPTLGRQTSFGLSLRYPARR